MMSDSEVAGISMTCRASFFARSHMKTIANYLMLTCVTALLSACSSSSPTILPGPPSINSVPAALKEEVIASKKESFNSSFEITGNFYVNNVHMNDVDMSQYQNGMNTMTIQELEKGNFIPFKMKFYQRTYSIAGLIHPDNPKTASDVRGSAFGGYATPEAYFMDKSVNYTYKGIAFSATQNGQFTYNVSIDHGTITGHGQVTGLSELGVIELGQIAFFQYGGTFMAYMAPATYANGELGSYGLLLAGPNAEEATGVVNKGTDDATKTIVVILSGER